MVNPKRPSRGFTLVELLVVIGIITILIAILLPTLGRAREHSRRVKCAANLHTIGHALILYTQQYNRYPGTFGYDGTVNQAVWPPRLKPYLAGNREVFYCPAQEDRCLWSNEGPQPVIRCASANSAIFGYESDEPLIHGMAFFSYGYNGQGFDARGGMKKGLGFLVLPSPYPIDQSSAQELPASRVRCPSEMIAIADATVDGMRDWYISGTEENAWPGRIHAGGSNALFCDGHVSWYHQKDLVVDANLPDSRERYKARMWSNDNMAD